MEPLSPQDPIHQLLGKARKVEVRPNFTSTRVMRQARQTPQERGWLAALRAWWEEAPSMGRLAVAGGAVAAVAVTFLMMQPTDKPVTIVETAPVVSPELPLAPEVEAPWEMAVETEALLAVESTSQFTDSEIGFLLY